MLRSKPQTAKSKRFLAAKESKLKEGPKKALFVKSTTCSNVAFNVMKDLFKLKKPNAILFSKANQIRPFEDSTSLEFFSEKNDTPLIVVGSHSKKRPHNLVFCRTFGNELYDMIELGIENFQSLKEFRGEKPGLGLLPLLVFKGLAFENISKYTHLRSFLVDFFGYGLSENTKLDATGIQYVIFVTCSIESKNSLLADNNTKEVVYMRSYYIKLRKGEGSFPRVELIPMGPNIDLVIRRIHDPTAEHKKAAFAIPKVKKHKLNKNKAMDLIGNTTARIHVGKQNVEKQQVRKFKGLKRSRQEASEESEKESFESANESD